MDAISRNLKLVLAKSSSRNLWAWPFLRSYSWWRCR